VGLGDALEHIDLLGGARSVQDVVHRGIGVELDVAIGRSSGQVVPLGGWGWATRIMEAQSIIEKDMNGVNKAKDSVTQKDADSRVPLVPFFR